MPVRTQTYIRRADREDLDTIVAWMEATDFQYFLYGAPARSRKQIREQIVAMLGRSQGHTMPGGVYLLIDAPVHVPVGFISLQNISWRNRACNLDVYIGNKEFRRGLQGGLAVFRALEYCFDELNLHRVAAYIYAFNRPSWRVLEATGAVREVTLRDHVVRDGTFYDVYCYGLLRPEFEAFREKYSGVEGVRLEDMIKAVTKDRAE